MRSRLHMAAIMIAAVIGGGCTRHQVEGPTDLPPAAFLVSLAPNALRYPYYHGDRDGMSFFSFHDEARDRSHGVKFGPFDMIFIGVSVEYEVRYRMRVADTGLVVSAPFRGWGDEHRMPLEHVFMISRFRQALPGLMAGKEPQPIENICKDCSYSPIAAYQPVRVIGREAWAFVGQHHGVRGYLYDPTFVATGSDPWDEAQPPQRFVEPLRYPGTIAGSTAMCLDYTSGSLKHEIFRGWHRCYEVLPDEPSPSATNPPVAVPVNLAHPVP